MYQCQHSKRCNTQKDVMDRNNRAVTEGQLALKARNLTSRLPLYSLSLPERSFAQIHRAVGQKEQKRAGVSKTPTGKVGLGFVGGGKYCPAYYYDHDRK